MSRLINEHKSSGPQGKRAILDRSQLEPLVVSIPEAAALLGLSKNTARQLFVDRDIPIITFGRKRKLIRISDLEHLLEEFVREASDA